MNRPIKFRCFYRDKMYDVREIQFFDDGSFLVSEIMFDLNGDGVLHSIFPDSEHIKGIMQFTGLHDRNGKEIYEGDLIKLDDIICPITWDDGAFQMITSKNQGKSVAIQDRVKHFEVIGDIYSTPELLNK